jgi:hypothetical protein
MADLINYKNIMRKIILGAGVLLVIGGAVYFAGNLPKSEKEPDAAADSRCVQICDEAKSICPSLTQSADCAAECAGWSEEVKNKVAAAGTCQDLSGIPELVSVLIPEMNAPEPINPSNDCEAACGSYVSKCLSLVPNATPALFEEGQSSCMDECAGWNAAKVECMISAFDCEAMTDVCGL